MCEGHWLGPIGNTDGGFATCSQLLDAHSDRASWVPLPALDTANLNLAAPDAGSERLLGQVLADAPFAQLLVGRRCFHERLDLQMGIEASSANRTNANRGRSRM